MKGGEGNVCALLRAARGGRSAGVHWRARCGSASACNLHAAVELYKQRGVAPQHSLQRGERRSQALLRCGWLPLWRRTSARRAGTRAPQTGPAPRGRRRRRRRRCRSARARTRRLRLQAPPACAPRRQRRRQRRGLRCPRGCAVGGGALARKLESSSRRVSQSRPTGSALSFSRLSVSAAGRGRLRRRARHGAGLRRPRGAAAGAGAGGAGTRRWRARRGAAAGAVGGHARAAGAQRPQLQAAGEGGAVRQQGGAVPQPQARTALRHACSRSCSLVRAVPVARRAARGRCAGCGRAVRGRVSVLCRSTRRSERSASRATAIPVCPVPASRG